MYESEVNQSFGSLKEIPGNVLLQFARSRESVIRRTLIPWGEHCTECVWPTCYSSCGLYTPRNDGRCRRFVEGMVRIDFPEGLNGYILKIEFKRWAKLWSVGNTRTYAMSNADRLEKRDHRISRYIQSIPGHMLKVKVIQKRYSWKKMLAKRQIKHWESPDEMLIECYNPNRSIVSMTLKIRRAQSPIPFQSLLSMQPGFNRHEIPLTDIAGTLDVSSQFEIELTPNEISGSEILYFGSLDFVVDSRISGAKRKAHVRVHDDSGLKPAMCKCVVWDLDGTLWDGILLEDGQEKLRLRPKMAEIMKALDERGILISAASKNKYEDGMSALKGFGIESLFLFPQISWDPKSQGIFRIAAKLNIGVDSILFIDDSEFERAEVRSACPGVRTLDAAEYLSILERPDCQAIPTEESRRRREYYNYQRERDTAQRAFKGGYLDFLRDCNLHLWVRPLREARLERVYELTQRTNQMNASGNRYDLVELRGLLGAEENDAYVLDCSDRFGAYGTIGFCTVKCAENCMTDLMFSCRVQAKRVEHAFICYILQKYQRKGTGDFYVNYRMTERNASFGKVFVDFGFEKIGILDGVTRLVHRFGEKIHDDGIIAVEEVFKED